MKPINQRQILARISSRFDTQMLISLAAAAALGAIRIRNQEARHLVVGKGLNNLLNRSVRRGMRRHIEMDDMPTLVSKDQ